ncbi:MAG: hypothetical protein C0597_07815, partial [Marinilabiliales bacterium]
MGINLRGSVQAKAKLDRVAILKDVVIFSESDDKILKKLSSILLSISVLTVGLRNNTSFPLIYS